MTEGIAFDHLNPPKSITDPQGLGALYPKHLHKAGQAEDGGPLYIVVANPHEEAEAIAEGWLLEKPNPNLERGLKDDAGRGPVPRRKT